ncbi:MAG: saccharopine dehydrogenase NADP-binding domain-containing protein [Candidatus Pelagadaptatus aseana]|uniref:saccharopine dehydrogenase family protein n=1 Tax=Candidatus Pelagadaptatus aseana TaxID=3120508 RepID=UPI0039B15D07
MGKVKYDLVLFGATSFVGKIMCRYLLDYAQHQEGFSWAMAGRSSVKLDKLKVELGKAADGIDVLLADAANEDNLRAVCEQTQVVISTVGPYALYGEPLVKVCAETGTDYCDLTGEVQWIDLMLQRYEATAKQSGARIVHCCGFDSIPSDLGAFFTQQQAQADFGEPCQQIKMRVKGASGGVSGGTVASLMNVTKEAAADKALRKKLMNPYLICPEGTPKVRQQHIGKAEYDQDFAAWMAPFVMAAINSRVVLRSGALIDGYGEGFQYSEGMMMGEGLKGRLRAGAMTAGLGGFMVASAIKPSRWVLEKFVVPKPGEGPSPESQEKGFYDLRFYGETTSGNNLMVKVTGDKDPGYGSTAKMLVQAGLCMAKDMGGKSGGFWTPASLFGEALIDRLQQHAGLTFERL